jgi:hypothetical protein
MDFRVSLMGANNLFLIGLLVIGAADGDDHGPTQRAGLDNCRWP